jgi:hypothetical protein
MDWLNGFEYHQDLKKRERVLKDFGLFWNSQDGLPIMLFAMVDMIKAIFSLADLVETLVQVQEGKRSEVSCPPSWLQE